MVMTVGECQVRKAELRREENLRLDLVRNL